MERAAFVGGGLWLGRSVASGSDVSKRAQSGVVPPGTRLVVSCTMRSDHGSRGGRNQGDASYNNHIGEHYLHSLMLLVNARLEDTLMELDRSLINERAYARTRELIAALSALFQLGVDPCTLEAQLTLSEMVQCQALGRNQCPSTVPKEFQLKRPFVEQEKRALALAVRVVYRTMYIVGTRSRRMHRKKNPSPCGNNTSLVQSYLVRNLARQQLDIIDSTCDRYTKGSSLRAAQLDALFEDSPTTACKQKSRRRWGLPPAAIVILTFLTAEVLHHQHRR